MSPKPICGSDESWGNRDGKRPAPNHHGGITFGSPLPLFAAQRLRSKSQTSRTLRRRFPGGGALEARIRRTIEPPWLEVRQNRSLLVRRGGGAGTDLSLAAALDAGFACSEGSASGGGGAGTLLTRAAALVAGFACAGIAHCGACDGVAQGRFATGAGRSTGACPRPSQTSLRLEVAASSVHRPRDAPERGDAHHILAGKCSRE